ncbi:hypothetical protein [Subtercola boreus]|nr:hypothetical protein [Subtercola boreus]
MTDTIASRESLLAEVEHLREQNRELVAQLFVLMLLIERETDAERV